MRKYLLLIAVCIFILCTAEKCDNERIRNTSAKDEQENTEKNQQNLNAVQPPPRITWSHLCGKTIKNVDTAGG